MANLFPEGYETEVINQEDLDEESVTGYRNGIAFDYETGDFKRDGRYKIMDSDGIESWRSWCINCLQTERYNCLAYSSDFGIETGKALLASSHAEAENILTREINEAIMADPYKRTEYIEDIVFDWSDPDTVCAQVTIHGISDVTIDITAYITRGAN